MKRWTRTLLLTAATAALGLTGMAAASGSTLTTDSRVASQAATADLQAQTNAPDVIVQTEYVPIIPCRIIDARNATPNSKIQTTGPRIFVVAGSSDLSGQGGNVNGCPIPLGATAIAASLTSTQADGAGFLRAWATGTPEPNSTVLNYTKLGPAASASEPPCPSSRPREPNSR